MTLNVRPKSLSSAVVLQYIIGVPHGMSPTDGEPATTAGASEAPAAHPADDKRGAPGQSMPHDVAASTSALAVTTASQAKPAEAPVTGPAAASQGEGRQGEAQLLARELSRTLTQEFLEDALIEIAIEEATEEAMHAAEVVFENVIEEKVIAMEREAMRVRQQKSKSERKSKPAKEKEKKAMTAKGHPSSNGLPVQEVANKASSSKGSVIRSRHARHTLLEAGWDKGRERTQLHSPATLPSCRTSAVSSSGAAGRGAAKSTRSTSRCSKRRSITEPVML